MKCRACGEVVGPSFLSCGSAGCVAGGVGIRNRRAQFQEGLVLSSPCFGVYSFLIIYHFKILRLWL